jgi:hypothetical protein
MKSKIVLSLCDLTTNILKPWAKAGYRCIAVDIQHPAGTTISNDGIELVGADINHYIPPLGDYTMVFAFPPCTHLAVSGARWFQTKGLPKLIEALTLVNRCRELCEWIGAPYMIENPVSTLATYWRKPDYTFNPCDYGGYLNPPGDEYTKKTCLWTGGGFVMPEPKPVEPVLGSKMHLLPPGPERANLRSETPMGFAQAVFETNGRAKYCLLNN